MRRDIPSPLFAPYASGGSRVGEEGGTIGRHREEHATMPEMDGVEVRPVCQPDSARPRPYLIITSARRTRVARTWARALRVGQERAAGYCRGASSRNLHTPQNSMTAVRTSCSFASPAGFSRYALSLIHI